jgi:hypothetical protein
MNHKMAFGRRASGDSVMNTALPMGPRSR